MTRSQIFMSFAMVVICLALAYALWHIETMGPPSHVAASPGVISSVSYYCGGREVSREEFKACLASTDKP